MDTPNFSDIHLKTSEVSRVLFGNKEMLRSHGADELDLPCFVFHHDARSGRFEQEEQLDGPSESGSSSIQCNLTCL